MSKHDFHRNFAIIIGINNYQNSIRELITAVPDALKLAEIIQKQHEQLKPQYQAQNKYEVQLLLNQRASLSQLKQLIADFKQGQITLDKQKVTVTERDRLLFYFAGHGIALDALENQEGPVGYLIPQDAVSGDSSTYLPMQELHDALNALPCRHMLAILDCCFAGAFRWASVKREIVRKVQIYKERYDRFISDRAWQVITSASDDQKALDSLGSRGRTTNGNEVHSPFAQALFDVLLGKGGDSNQDGMVTATELYSYLRDQVEIASENYYQRQTPSLCPLRKHDKGEFIFLLPDFDRDKLEDAPPLNVENNPYRGLSSYDEKDSHLFFGREEQIQKLYQKVVDNKQQLTLVLGASGTGKSSLVKAGLIPKLRKDDKTWRILPPFRPGESPLKSLNNVLELVKQPLIQAGTSSRLFNPAEESLGNWFKNNPQAKLLVVIDQFEELITLSKSEEAEKFQIFIKNILAKYANNIHIVITLRLDFEAQFQNSVLNDFWNDNARFVVAPMSQNEFRQAIEKPALEKVLYFDPPSLVDELINEVVQMPGALPLLSFTLSELYLKYLGDRTRDNRALTKKDYEELGRVVGSLTKRANQEYENLVKENPAYQDTVRRVMLRMISLQGGELARRQVHKSELVYSDQEENQRVQTVIKRFSEARLIVEGSNAQGEPYVEPAHDALVQGWDQLLAWKKENEENIILQRRLTPDAEEWKSIKAKFQPLGLQTKAKTAVDWVDHRLYTIENSLTKISAQFARLWRRSQNQQKHYGEKPVQFLWDANPYLDVVAKEISSDDHWLNQVEADFVEESVLQKRRNMSWRWRIAIAVILGLSGLTIAALIGQRSALIAQIGELRQTAEISLRQNQTLDGMIQGLRAGNLFQKPILVIFPPPSQLKEQVRGTLQQAIYTVRESNRLEASNRPIKSVSFHPKGELLATSGDDGVVRVWNLQNQQITELFRHEGSILSVTFSPDGQQLAVAQDDGVVSLWDLQGQLLTDFKAHQSQIRSIDFSPDSQKIATAGGDGFVRLWSLQGERLAEFTEHQNAVDSIKFSPDGQSLVSAGIDGLVILRNLEDKRLTKLQGHESPVHNAIFSPDGQFIASAGGDKTVRLWDLKGNVLRQWNHDQIKVWDLAFSPDGEQIATAGGDGTVRVWHTQTQEQPQKKAKKKTQAQSQELERFVGHQGPVRNISFSPDGRKIASVSDDLTVRLWNLPGQEFATSQQQQKPIKSISFNQDASFIVSVGDDGIYRWDLKGQQLLGSKIAPGQFSSLSVSSDGQLWASGGTNGSIYIWNIKGQQLAELKGHQKTVRSFNFSSDNQTLVSAGDDGAICLWNLPNQLSGSDSPNCQKLPLVGNEQQNKINSVSFSGDGKSIVTAGESGIIHVWHLEDKPTKQQFDGHLGSVNSAVFSPDGQKIVSGGSDGTVRVWNLHNEEQQMKRLFQLYGPQVMSVAFSRDGKTIISSSDDGNVQLWDTEIQTQLPLAAWRTEQSSINSISLSQNDSLLATAGADGSIKLWRLESFAQLKQRACDRLRDYLKNNLYVSISDYNLCEDLPATSTNPKN
jgi:WD40 repeat protein